ncbi:hypothetical protein NOCA1130410 [metagenome]|uniref:Uncharacterized protein n=1 Tax=metagenome TaxID=256318 RepID=A0A2P2CB90_9ZZZZ
MPQCGTCRCFSLATQLKSVAEKGRDGHRDCSYAHLPYGSQRFGAYSCAARRIRTTQTIQPMMTARIAVHRIAGPDPVV